VIKLLRTNSKKQVRHTVFFQIKKKNKITTTLAMQLLKVVVEDKVVVLVVQIFQISLKIFLVILVEEGLEVEGVLIIEALI
jgi:hypothetical protein